MCDRCLARHINPMLYESLGIDKLVDTEVPYARVEVNDVLIIDWL